MDQSTADIRSRSIAQKRDKDKRAKYNYYREINPGQATEPHILVESNWTWEPSQYKPVYGVDLKNPAYADCKLVPGISGRDLIRNAYNIKFSPETCPCCVGPTNKPMVSARKASRALIPVHEGEQEYYDNLAVEASLKHKFSRDEFFDTWVDWDMDLYQRICDNDGLFDLDNCEPIDYIPTSYDISPLLDQAEKKWEAKEEKALVQLGWEDTWDVDYWEQEEAEWSDLESETNYCSDGGDTDYGLFD